MSRRDLAAFVILCCAGWLAGVLAMKCRRPAPRPSEIGVHTEPFRMTRSAADPFFVTESSWLELPMLREDFDLTADVELADGAELDLVLRRVEPRPLHGVSLPFQSRFAALRLSTLAEGPAWRTPTTALFGEPGGVRLGGGLPASLEIKARGRKLTGSVAFKPLPEWFAQDDHGSLALIARGGTVALRTLHVVPLPREAGWTAGWLGLLGGAVLGLLAACTRRGPVRALLSGAALAAAPSAFVLVVTAALPPLTQPDAADELVAALAGAPLALACLFLGAGWIRSAVFVLLGALASGAALGKVSAEVRDRFPATPQLDEVFGEGARETITETLAQRVRGPLGIYTLAPLQEGQRRLFLLGGQLLWRRGAAPDQHVETMLTGELRGVDPKRPEVEVISLPTVDGWAQQQWTLFSRFFRGFAPAVVVLGVPRDEDAPDRSGVPRSSAEALRATIAEAKKGCAEIGAQLVLLADYGLASPLLDVLRSERDAGAILVEVTENDAASGIARKLAEAARPLLER